MTTSRLPRARRLGAWLLAVSLPALGCRGDAASATADATATVDTVNGVERLRYTAEAGPLLEWTVHTVAVLGDAFAEDAYQFNEVSRNGLAGDSEGGLLVLDRQGKRVLRYGPDGTHRGTYGRGGEGPGELAQPFGMVVGPGDTVWVSDFSNGRLTGYPPEGGEARSVPFPDNSGFPSPRLAVVDGGYVLWFLPMFSFGPGRGGGTGASRGDDGEGRAALSLVRYDRADFQPRDTLWSTPEPPTDIVQLEMGDGVMMTVMAREFHPEFLWAPFSDGGFVVSDSAGYVLHLLGPDGGVERVVEHAPAPRPVTEADRESARERVREAAAGGGMRMGGVGPDEQTQQRMLEQRLAKMTFAETVPRIVRLEVDARDRIWVGVSGDVAGEVDRIDIYDRQGHLIGQLRDFAMPDVFLTDGRVGLLRRDDLDVQQVVVLEVLEEGEAEIGSGA